METRSVLHFPDRSLRSLAGKPNKCIQLALRLPIIKQQASLHLEITAFPNFGQHLEKLLFGKEWKQISTNIICLINILFSFTQQHQAPSSDQCFLPNSYLIASLQTHSEASHLLHMPTTVQRKVSIKLGCAHVHL